MADPMFDGTQFNDMIGQVAFDGHTGPPLQELAAAANVPDTHWVIGFQLYRLDPEDSGLIPFTVIAVEKSSIGNRTEEIIKYQKTHLNLPATRFEGELSPNQFSAIFKRIEISVVQRGYEMDKIDLIHMES